jgi:molybdopterin synthase sulfur carrier subunit
MAEMTLEVLLFADVAQTCGTDRLSTTCPQGSTVDQLLTLLIVHHPELASKRDAVAVAVNECYVECDHILQDGDTVALIPPVSGG